jgi:hypothetical protein
MPGLGQDIRRGHRILQLLEPVAIPEFVATCQPL